jgi:dehydrogenase/reductase SDR family protein 12
MWFSVVAMAQWYPLGLRYYGHRGFTAARATWSDPDMAQQRDLSSRHYMVTGANAGLGHAMTEELAKRGATVHMVCRSAERGEAARAEIVESAKAAGVAEPQVHVHLADLGSFDSIRAFAGAFKRQHPVLHGLINNAGVLLNEEQRTTGDSLETTVAIAVGGSFLLTGLLLPELQRAPHGRVVNVSSGGQYLTGVSDPRELLDSTPLGSAYNGTAAYSQAKRVQVELTKRWASEPAAEGIVFHAMHPGWAVTPGVVSSIGDFYDKNRGMMRDAQQGADTAVWLAIAAEPGESNGRFWFDRAEARTDLPLARTAWSDADRELLWQQCARVCGWPDAPPTSA